MQMGSLPALLRIFDAQKVCLPVVREYGATFIRTFADDIVALFDAPAVALDASLEIRERFALPVVSEFEQLVFSYAVFPADGRADVQSEDTPDQ